ncbi:hypothetical protein L228DRAFT_243607 [Xylona heveae TC161]|uniref:DnaJ homologue subfamily C member 28 conserved domain-containing protein n=1 Tax=Xylona heveae (strain CBS 132557 / TC161) TaxID=1328760 RepID=A0A165IGN6_XYLHT|nr:hypothetical protein L228DRAFT_243607 [Xylona heveae TC161]KZF24868.1 hypothetical protein L228DRAFT_243607 [Xylona heveae TC161]
MQSVTAGVSTRHFNFCSRCLQNARVHRISGPEVRRYNVWSKREVRLLVETDKASRVRGSASKCHDGASSLGSRSGGTRLFSSNATTHSAPGKAGNDTKKHEIKDGKDHNNPSAEGKHGESSKAPAKSGAMSRRLAEMTEESLETGGRTARKVFQEAGFSEDLRLQLEERIASAKFRSDNASAFAQVNMSSSAGKGTRDVAAAQPWAGSETIADSALRMLNDAHKPLRTGRPPPIPTPKGGPPPTLKPKLKLSPGERLAGAKERTNAYTYMNDPTVSDREREQIRRELKERFTPGARAMPATLQGLSSLANERIDDAIARGQFKNLPRGKAIERDYNVSSPFIDTTEYLMNKIIQRQDIVPPWIEKQQELAKAAASFRGRLRADWKRHAARVIASKGGSLQEQMRRAEAHAYAESVENPPTNHSLVPGSAGADAAHAYGQTGNTSPAHMTTIDLQGNLVTREIAPAAAAAPSDAATSSSGDAVNTNHPAQNEESIPPPSPTVPPFRDPTWVETEQSYLSMAVNNLNTLTRSYNLMAPDLAKKPYFNLDRELRACFADVAPQLAGVIHERATAPPPRVEIVGHRAGSVLDKLGAKDNVRVYDSKRPNYGFKDLWKDLFRKG